MKRFYVVLKGFGHERCFYVQAVDAETARVKALASVNFSIRVTEEPRYMTEAEDREQYGPVENLS